MIYFDEELTNPAKIYKRTENVDTSHSAPFY